MDTTLDDPLVGRSLDGRYRIDARIAVGGMATVYRALDTRLDRVLALKVMHPDLAADAAFVDRFIREAKSVARLAHPNVVAVFDQGTDGPYVFLAMEYVPGCTLRDVLRERGALQPRAALDILEPVLAALGAAHRAGFVHRDMKPENVLIGDDGRVKVADFGLVRAVGSATNTTGAVLGTVSYLAPEQIENGTTDPRVDVYACGVVLYEMLTGGKPHSGDTPAQVLYRHLNEDVPPPSAAVPGLPAALDEAVASATARSADLRPYDAVALLQLVREARAALTDAQLDAVPPQARAGERSASEDRTSVVPRPVAGRESVHHTARFEHPPVADPAPAPRRRPRPRGPLFAALGALLVVLLGTGVWYVSSGQFTRVPNLLGKTQEDAQQRLAAAGLDVEGVRREFSDSYERGTVMATDPAGGARIRGNGSVVLTVSRGPKVVTVPTVKGMPLAQARKALAKAGLAPGVVTQEFSRDVARGAAISTDPGAGEQRAPDTAVAIVVSKGAPVPVPTVVGEPLDRARTTLEALGLVVQVAPEQTNSPQPAGAVANQSVAAGTQAGTGDTIVLTVSKGPRMVPVPNVVGQDQDDAKRALEAAGFKVKVDRPLISFSHEVAEQSVKGGESAPEGSTITIRIKAL
ncbi:Stk1 family PASTA domain-containing Ser/Thr kinase [Streptomyces sp. NRRL S-87]|uniref:Stk1 family PASTA domain-containing Ser/Thr kinase n=1 Tax=Streptomyces sp. NRRL S-87 TaxID=1463920 RepID=UPI0004BE7D36|nr:Stk1 family PASTA domain-containing Ser/Thr kinase [Streptomyces sp. NRRL S-87]